MSYSVNEIFYSLQGEGFHSGRPSVFCRFSGCNLWSGIESDRASAKCKFCDTKFVGTSGDGGGAFASASQLSLEISRYWPRLDGKKHVILTGGEPLLQADDELVASLHDAGFSVAIETNGTIAAPNGIDWITVSPKVGNKLRQSSGSELKLVFPQNGVDPDDFTSMQFDFFFIQPMDGPQLERNTRMAVDYCLKHPLWRLSLQNHKILALR